MAAAVDRIEAHRDAVLHVAADGVDEAAAHVGHDIAVAGRVVDAPPHGARLGIPPGRTGGARGEQGPRPRRAPAGAATGRSLAWRGRFAVTTRAGDLGAARRDAG